MSKALALLSACLLIGFCSCSKSKPETLVEGGYDEQEMDAAIARARTEADFFIAELQGKRGENFAVKVPVTDQGKTEHFWLTDVVFANDEFEGKIGNDPGIVSNVKFGQTWKLKKNELSDWMFMRDGKMHGNYTMRPLLKSMPKDQAEKFRSLFAKP